VILLFNTNFEPSQPRVSSPTAVIAGMSPFDPALLSQISPDDLAAEALISVDGLLKDQTIAINWMNDTCLSTDGCFSYILPGSFDEIIVQSSQSLASSLPFEGKWFIAEEVPVYRLDYFPLQSNVYFAQSDCPIYASLSSAVKVCLKNVEENLIAGIQRILRKLIHRLDGMPCIYCGHRDTWRVPLHSSPDNVGQRYERYLSASYFFIFRHSYLRVAGWRNLFDRTLWSPNSGPICRPGCRHCHRTFSIHSWQSSSTRNPHLSGAGDLPCTNDLS